MSLTNLFKNKTLITGNMKRGIQSLTDLAVEGALLPVHGLKYIFNEANDVATNSFLLLLNQLEEIPHHSLDKLTRDKLLVMLQMGTVHCVLLYDDEVKLYAEIFRVPSRKNALEAIRKDSHLVKEHIVVQEAPEKNSGPKESSWFDIVFNRENLRKHKGALSTEAIANALSGAVQLLPYGGVLSVVALPLGRAVAKFIFDTYRRIFGDDLVDQKELKMTQTTTRDIKTLRGNLGDTLKNQWTLAGARANVTAVLRQAHSEDQIITHPNGRISKLGPETVLADSAVQTVLSPQATQVS